MRIPRIGSSGRIVVDIIYKYGPMTIEQGLQKHRILGTYLSRTKDVYRRAVKNGWLMENCGVYSLSEAMQMHLDHDTESEKKAASDVLTPPPMPRQFKPLALWRLPKPHNRREDAGTEREPHFFNGSVMQAPFRGAFIESIRIRTIDGSYARMDPD